MSSENSEALPAGWLIEPPVVLHESFYRLTASQAVLLSRYSLLDLSTFCSIIVLFHVFASWLIERSSGKGVEGVPKPEGERSSVPRSEGRRSWYYIIFALALSSVMIAAKIATSIFRLRVWMCAYFYLIFLANKR